MVQNFEANFFTLLEFLDAESRLQVEAVCSRRSVQPQEVICEQGSEAHDIYIVESGVVEAFTLSPDGQQTRAVGVMSRGDFFGDLAVFTGSPRLAMVRACEPTELLSIEKMIFMELLERIPKMGHYFAKNLAQRLYETSTKAHVRVFDLDLTGNLRHFDLLTIFQAITSMGRSGELKIKNSDNELVGDFYFREGGVEYARFSHLEGIEAVWQGFLESCTDGNFTFQVLENPASPFSDEHRVVIGPTDLVMQGATRRDVYYTLPEPLRMLDGRLGRTVETLAWSTPETQALATKVWEFLARRPQPLASLSRRVNYSTLTFLKVVEEMLASGQAELLPPASPDTPTDTQQLPKP